MNVYEKIEAYGIVPVIKLNDSKNALPLCKALADGGLPVAEITFRTDAAEESIRQVASNLPEVLVGAGTVTCLDQAERAKSAGAKFIVTPGFNAEVIDWCLKNDMPVFPGCPTTTDIEAAIRFGLKILKFFPAEAMGGLKTIKAVCAPYPSVRFMPTGGVSEANMNDYLSFSKIVAVGGSWMVSDALIESGDFNKITEMTKSAVLKMLGFEIAHIGIGCEDEKAAIDAASKFSAIFNWPVKAGNSSVFSGTFIEATKGFRPDFKNHIAVFTNSVLRAKAYLERAGFQFDESTAVMKNDKLIAIYLKEDICGFGIHLLQK